MLGPVVSKEFLISAKIDGITFKIAENGTENGKSEDSPKSFLVFFGKIALVS